MDDYISLYIYAWDKEKQDIKLFLFKKDNQFKVPRCKVSESKKYQKNSTAVIANKSTTNDSKVSLPNNDIPDKVTESNWTFAVDELWNKITNNEVKRSSAELIDLLRVYSCYKRGYYYHASFAIQVQVNALDKLHSKPENFVIHHKNLKTKSLERYQIHLTVERLYKLVEGSILSQTDRLTTN
ncbi:hypothetical protein Avbf_02241 [Armadillidium vulgare]|nr:hypothetical protein Avbf_02241 [Armadillidium vulgare]